MATLPLIELVFFYAGTCAGASFFMWALVNWILPEVDASYQEWKKKRIRP